MIDSTTSPMDKQFKTFLTQSYKKKKQGKPFTHLEEEALGKHSKLVRTLTKKKRAQLPHKVRQQQISKSKASTDAQQVSELQLLPIMTGQEITSKAGIKERTSMKTEAALAVKETVGFTGSQLCTQRKFWNLTLPYGAK
ncbi:hypothetical protein RRG08_030359 [Elysia crispata]|uniref:Uncharacterized protein n=1 Tax=Elysia crispata TaxID=231223 RepID=A0AAE1CZX7_9GAST|nr:hypothetical protein RRG08_030359 [Elysia crispata]